MLAYHLVRCRPFACDVQMWLRSEATPMYLPFPHERNDAKMMAWTTIVLGCADQLRHRVAFALSQILVIGEDGLSKQEEFEVYGSYYDIFVRNAFGRYFDGLREVAYSPAMAHYLTFNNNRAFANRGNTPDENFAREIMRTPRSQPGSSGKASASSPP